MRRHHTDGHGYLRHLGGHKRDRRHRIGHYKAIAMPAAPMPTQLLLADEHKVPTRDQGQAGSCVGQSYGLTADAELARNGLYSPETRTSAEDAYKVVREFEGTPLSEDSGAEIGDMHEAAGCVGVCSEELAPYSDAPEVYSAERTEAQREDALQRKLQLTLECPSIEQIKHALLQGFAVQTGFQCYPGLMTLEAATTGNVPLPQGHEAQLGSHAVAIVGWDDEHVIGTSKGCWICRNSWGDWGATIGAVRGYFYLPFDYHAHGLAGDNHSPRLIGAAA